MKKIAIEEHFTTAALAHYSLPAAALFDPPQWDAAMRRLLDFTDVRLPQMDELGIDMEVLSLTAPGIQAETDTAVAVKRAAEANDFLAEITRRHPTRFSGFAALALQNPEGAAAELERAVTQLGLRGALINGHTHGEYLDADRFRPVWERAEALGVPIYLRPASSYDVWHSLRGHEELIGPMWSWGLETATHALRIVFGGVFDRFPRRHPHPRPHGRRAPRPPVAPRQPMGLPQPTRHPPGQATPLGLHPQPHHDHHQRRLCTRPLLGSLLALGADRIMFSTDYPLESNQEAVRFIETAPISETDRAKICHLNAQRLLGL